MNYILEYDNIFHYYKGQSRDDSNTLQTENNTTKALINVLQHGPKELTDGFLRLISNRIQLNNQNDFTHMIQITEKLLELGTDGFVLGIAEEIHETHATDYTNKNSIPDAAIISEDIVVLIETKIGSNTKLNTGQMEKHKDKFHKDQVYKDSLEYLSWKKIRDYFKEQQNKYCIDSVTGFLLRQFDQFREINGLGGITREHYFNYFPLKTRKLAKELDEYIWSGNFDIIDPPNTKRGIAYKRNNRRGGFAKLCADRKCLILRYGSKGSFKGIEMQRELDHLLGKIYPRKDTDMTKYSHETFLELRWVKNLEQIKPYIQKAYDINS
ncbi:hypothetical protein ACOI1C_14150 [Bacillus sp. DJP31]|uniref:hypothetical protein n=1 Tax=Bacillus sp. DJP31 TaxID=3409789 RepID=UPI003BB5DE87